MTPENVTSEKASWCLITMLGSLCAWQGLVREQADLRAGGRQWENCRLMPSSQFWSKCPKSQSWPLLTTFLLLWQLFHFSQIPLLCMSKWLDSQLKELLLKQKNLISKSQRFFYLMIKRGNLFFFFKVNTYKILLSWRILWVCLDNFQCNEFGNSLKP